MPCERVDDLRSVLERSGYVVSRCYEEDGYLTCSVIPRNSNSAGIVRVGDIWLDRRGRLAGVAGRLIPLTELEAALFQVLLERCGRVVTIEELLIVVWQDEAISSPRGRLYTLIFALRSRLEGNPLDLRIEAARNGYRLWAEGLSPEYLPNPLP